TYLPEGRRPTPAGEMVCPSRVGASQRRRLRQGAYGLDGPTGRLHWRGGGLGRAAAPLTPLVGFRRPPPAQPSGERPGHLRLPGVHAALVSNPRGAMASGVSDPACASGAGHPVRLRLVPRPAARGVEGATRRAPESLTGPLQLLRGQWEPEAVGLS